MAAKPSELPEWASGGGAVTSTPSSGRKAAGWAVGERGIAHFFNWWQKLVYQWMQYVNDGVFDGDHEFLDNVEIQGDLTVNGNIIGFSNGTLTYSLGDAFDIGAGTPWARSTAGGKQWATTDAGGLAVMYKHFDGLPVGKKIVEMTARLKDAGASGAIAISLIKSVDGTETTLAGPTNSNALGTASDVVFSGLNETIAQGASYYVKFQSNGINPGARTVYGAALDIQS